MQAFNNMVQISIGSSYFDCYKSSSSILYRAEEFRSTECLYRGSAFWEYTEIYFCLKGGAPMYYKVSLADVDAYMDQMRELGYGPR